MSAESNFSLVELARLVANLIRHGVIEQVDLAAEPPAARVRLRSGLLTDWLPWQPKRAAGNRSWDPVEVGEAVIVLAESGDLANGVILPALYTSTAQAPSANPDKAVYVFSDGAVIEYDRAAHALTATLPSGGTADITVPGAVNVTSNAITLTAPQITLDAANTHLTGDLDVDGDITDHATEQDRTVAGMRAIYDDHRHISNGPAVLTEPPDEDMGA